MLVHEPVKYLSRLSQYYKRYYGQQEALIARLEAKARHHWRAQSLLRMANAVRVSLNLLTAATTDIHRLIVGNDTDITSADNFMYTNNFQYLFRDWSGHEEVEREIAMITQAIVSGSDLSRSSVSPKAVFLGAATGRYAYEMNTYFEEIICLDYSPAMAGLHYLLRRGNISFSRIAYKNAEHISTQIIPATASLQRWYASNNITSVENIRYIIGDALKMPLKQASADMIFSIYFTDTVPFQRLLSEIKRVLKPGGTFVHFGPLEYHFDDVSEMLTCEEVKTYADMLGFQILTDQEHPGPHLDNIGSLKTPVYRNKLLVFKKDASEVTLHSFISLIQPVKFVSEETDKGMVYKVITCNGGEYNVSPSSFEWLQLIEDRISVGVLIKKIQDAFEVEGLTEKDFIDQLSFYREVGLLKTTCA